MVDAIKLEGWVEFLKPTNRQYGDAKLALSKENNMKKKQLTRMGIFLLEEAVLGVLIELERDEYVSVAEIDRRIGAFRNNDDLPSDRGHWLAHYIIDNLNVHGKLEFQHSGDETGRRRGIRLTSEEYERLQE
jgi:hypothetical protein